MFKAVGEGPCTPMRALYPRSYPKRKGASYKIQVDTPNPTNPVTELTSSKRTFDSEGLDRDI